MLDYSIMVPEGILVLEPQAPLGEKDFSALGAAVTSYLSDHAVLLGVLIRSKAFPGWENFGGFLAHMHFIRQVHRKVARVAVVTDSPIAGLAESLGNHFTSAKVRHFPFAEGAKALRWLGSPQSVTAHS